MCDWMPYTGDAYPPEWVATLDAVDTLEFDHIGDNVAKVNRDLDAKKY